MGAAWSLLCLFGIPVPHPEAGDVTPEFLFGKRGRQREAGDTPGQLSRGTQSFPPPEVAEAERSLLILTHPQARAGFLLPLLDFKEVFGLFFSLPGSGCTAGGRQGMQERMRMVCWDIPIPRWAQG